MPFRNLLDLLLARVRPDAPDNAPLTAFERARIEWFERYGCAVVERNRMFLGWVLTTVALLAASLAIAALLPLKTVEPFVVRVADNGQVALDRAAAQRYVPGRAERTYFVSRWVQQVLTLDPYLTERQLSEAWRMTSGLATRQLLDWLRAERPLERLRRDPGLSRSVAIVTVVALDESVMQVRARTETRAGAGEPRSAVVQVTLHYTLVPPRTEAEIMRNPIGLYVTRFNVVEELS